MSARGQLRTYLALPRAVHLLCVAKGVASLGNFVYPFLTLILVTRLGYSEKVAGDALLVMNLAMGGGMLLGGRLVDLLGRRTVLLFAGCGAALCYSACAQVTQAVALQVLLSAGGFCWTASFPAYQAALNDLTTESERSAAFSLLGFASNIACAVGPAVAGALFTRHFAWVFLGNGAVQLLAVAILAFGFEESRPQTKPSPAAPRGDGQGEGVAAAQDASIFSALAARPRLVAFLLLVSLTAFVYAQVFLALPLHAHRLFGAEGPAKFGRLMAVNGVAVVLATLPLVALTHRLRPAINMVVAAILYALGFGAIAFCGTFASLVISTVVWSLGEVLATTYPSVQVSSDSPAEQRGRFHGLLLLSSGLGSAISPLFFGRLIGSTGLSAAWPVAAGAALIAALGFWSLRRAGRLSAESPDATQQAP